MSQEFKDLSALLDHGYDTVIDVRSPAEFAEDHVPGAINMPVLDNAERAEVGTVYVQKSSFLARKIGAVKVFRNAARNIELHLADHEGGWRPLVYCWRGGQRSGAFCWMLEQIGWRADVIDGGYKTYRRLVKSALYDHPLRYPVISLSGYTGTAKTALLHCLRDAGEQVLDLEGLAGHRGSLLGAQTWPQPSQKAFESGIAATLSRFDPGRPVIVEAESSKIGALIIPPSLWKAMQVAPRVELTAPISERTAFLVAAYDDILSDTTRLQDQLNRLRAHRGHAVVDGWMQLIDDGDKAGLTRALMQQHYDPAYDTSRKSSGRVPRVELAVERLDPAGLQEAATRIAAAVAELAQTPESTI